MGLIEDAIAEYEKYKEKVRKNQEEERKKSIDEGIQTIKEKFGDKIEIDVIVENDYVSFLVDGLKMRTGRTIGYCRDIYLVQKCPKCGEEYMESVVSLTDIGKILKEGHGSYDCKRIMELKSVKKEMNTDERLLDALRNFIHENSREK